MFVLLTTLKTFTFDWCNMCISDQCNAYFSSVMHEVKHVHFSGDKASCELDSSSDSAVNPPGGQLVSDMKAQSLSHNSSLSPPVPIGTPTSLSHSPTQDSSPPSLHLPGGLPTAFVFHCLESWLKMTPLCWLGILGFFTLRVVAFASHHTLLLKLILDWGKGWHWS